MMVTFQSFKRSIFELVFPEGMAEQRVPLFRNFVVNGLIQLQTFVESYQLVNTAFYDKDQSWDDCGLSIIQGCRGQVGAVYAFKPSCRCQRFFYEPASLEKLSCLYEECRCAQNRCSPASIFAAGSYVADPAYCGYKVDGNAGCRPPYLAMEPEDDCAFKLASRYFAIGPNNKIWLFPRFPCGYLLGVHWRGIRRTYLDTDYVLDDEDLKDAVATYVESEVARRVDKDQVLADRLYADYRLKAGDIIFREERDLRPRATRICVEGLDQSELIGIYPDNPYPVYIGEQCQEGQQEAAITVNPLLTSKLAIYYKCDDLALISGGDFDGFLGTSDFFDVCDLNTGNSSGDPELAIDGIISNALNFPSDHIDIGLNSPGFTTQQKALFNGYQQSFTVRFWIRLQQAGTGDLFMTLNDLGPADNQWTAEVTGANKVTWRLFGQTVTSTEALVVGQWHRVIFSRDYANALISIKIDDNATVTAAYTGTDANPGIDYFLIGNRNFAFDIDEIGIWKDYVLTEDDMTYDWNNGSGKTVPFT